MFGTNTVNPYVKGKESIAEAKKYQHTTANKEWVHRQAHVNRAACVASGDVIEKVSSCC